MATAAAATARDRGAPDADAVRLGRRRVYILPTGHGVLFGAVLLVMLVGSVNYNNSLGYVLTFLLAGLGLVSMLHTWRNLAGLTVRPGRALPIFAGAEARFGLCLDNRGQPPRRELCLGYHPGGSAHRRARTVLRVQLEADAIRTVELPVATARRGWQPLGRVSVATRYPLGLFRAWSPLDPGLRCLVYPAPAGSRGLPPQRPGAAGEGAARGQGRDDFSGFRDYVPGDSPRRIHWKAVARDQGLPVKLFSGAAPAELVLRWEDAAGGTEVRLGQLCRWLLEAQGGGLRYGLELPDARLPVSGGGAHLHACLRALALSGRADGDGG